MFMTDYEHNLKHTQDDDPAWRKMVRRVLVAMRAYSIVIGDELLPEGNISAARTLEKEWHRRANDAVAQIHVGCTDDLLPCIYHIDDPVEIWQTLQRRVDNTTNQVGQTRIVRKFHALHPSTDETITQYFTKLIDLRKKLIWSAKAISDKTMKTHIFFAIPKEFETTIKILEQQIALPMAQQVMDHLRENTVRTELAMEIGDESTGSALYSHRGDHNRRGRGGHEWGRARENFVRDCANRDDKEYSCTHCKMNIHTTERCGILKRLKSASGGFNRKKSKEMLCFYRGNPGHARAECESRQWGLEAQNKINKRSNLDSMSAANMAQIQHGILTGESDLFSLLITTNAAAVTSSTASIPTCVVDWAASHTMCNNRSLFISYDRLPSPITMKLGDDMTVTATYHGPAHIMQDLQLDALYTPTFRLSLLSIRQLEHAGYMMTFRSGKCFISTDINSTTSIITAKRFRYLYILQSPNALASEGISAKVVLMSKATTSSRKEGKKTTQSQPTEMTSGLTPASTITARLWHRWSAHLDPAAKRSWIDGLNNLDETMCDVCFISKMQLIH